MPPPLAKGTPAETRPAQVKATHPAVLESVLSSDESFERLGGREFIHLATRTTLKGPMASKIIGDEIQYTGSVQRKKQSKSGGVILISLTPDSPKKSTSP
jgi:hypothetical protein